MPNSTDAAENASSSRPSESSSVRLFVAVDPESEARAAVGRAIDGVCDLAPKAKWIDATSMHVTLVFLGRMPTAQIAALGEAIDEVALRHGRFELALRSGGTFGARAHPRVLWLGLGGDVAALIALQEDVVRALVPLGHMPESRAFSPHLTLARARVEGGDPALAACSAKLAEVPEEPWMVSEVILYQSDLSRTGARYTPIHRTKLSAR